MLVEYQHWPMKQELFDDLNRCQSRAVTHILQTKPMLKNWISAKTDV
jgi:hypothetical protein